MKQFTERQNFTRGNPLLRGTLHIHMLRCLPSILLLSSVSAFATIQVALNPTPVPPQLLGTPITWTATGSDSNPGTLEYQFAATRGGGAFQIIRDFSPTNNFTWAVSSKEGSYTIQVTTRNVSTQETVITQVPFNVASRVTGTNPVVSSTANPLVMLYSAPGCPIGSEMYVHFGTGKTFTDTDSFSCTPNRSMNFYLAGMLPQTPYVAYYIVKTGLKTARGPVVSFTTGALHAGLYYPNVKIVNRADPRSSLSQPVLLLDILSLGTYLDYFPVAVDLNGRVIWYYNNFPGYTNELAAYLRPVPNSGGHMLVLLEDPNVPSSQEILREVDLAGNTVQETNVGAINEQLAAQGKLGINDFDHDVLRLPNGHTLVISAQEEIFPPGTQGSPGPVDIAGDAVLDLDQNFQVSWYWSAYDHLDINRGPTLGETFTAGTGGCPPLTLSNVAVDWLHANSLDYIPSSGDIIVSLRHQDWVIKLDYSNGAGAGTVLWRLGLYGDFAINSTDPYPWFSHQHNASYVPGGTTALTLYDNGNTRYVANPGVTEHSRGYVLNMDEATLNVTPILLADLGFYSTAVGSAQKLANGNYFFDTGAIGALPNTVSQNAEILPDGTNNFVERNSYLTYRGYRMSTLYTTNDSDRNNMSEVSATESSRIQ